MKAALDCRRPAAVPIWEIEFHAWDAASGRHVVLGREMERLSVAEQERAMHCNAEIMLDVCREMHYAALTVPAPYWNQSPGELAYYVLPGELRFRQMAILRELAGEELMLIGNASAVLCARYNEEFCDQLFNRPHEVDEMARGLLNYGLETAKRYRDAGATAVFTASDIADNSGPFFNPGQMQRFILPYVDRWAREVNTMGLYSILHTDGQITPVLNDLAETRLDAVQAIDPVAGMDMAQAREIVGDRLCLCGNMDCGLLLRGTAEQVYQATQSLLALTCDGPTGLVLGASNAVQPEAPMANYRAMIQAWRDFEP